MKRSVRREDLLIGQAQGLYPTALARKLGTSRVAVLFAEQADGIRLNRCIPGERPLKADYRAAVEDMKPLAAVEYLLSVIDGLQDKPAQVWELPGVHLTRGERNVLYALARAKGRTLSRDALLSAYMIDRGADDAPNVKLVDVYICKLRKKLAATGATIRNSHGFGYGLSVPDGFVWPWEVSA